MYQKGIPSGKGVLINVASNTKYEGEFTGLLKTGKGLLTNLTTGKFIYEG
jgi:hypothetical protein